MSIVGGPQNKISGILKGPASKGPSNQQAVNKYGHPDSTPNSAALKQPGAGKGVAPGNQLSSGYNNTTAARTDAAGALMSQNPNMGTIPGGEQPTYKSSTNPQEPGPIPKGPTTPAVPKAKGPNFKLPTFKKPKF